jgi:hypothetical protein
MSKKMIFFHMRVLPPTSHTTTYPEYSRELIELVFVQPYCRIENVVDAGIAKRQTASTYLHRLESVGTLQQRQLGLNTLFMKPGSSSC